MAGIENIRQDNGKSYRGLCADRKAPYSSLMRWRKRLRQAKAVVKARGAACTPVTVEKLWERLLSLPHGRHRTRGSGAAYKAYRGLISRRELRRMLKMLRLELSRDRAALMRSSQERRGLSAERSAESAVS